MKIYMDKIKKGGLNTEGFIVENGKVKMFFNDLRNIEYNAGIKIAEKLSSYYKKKIINII